MQCRHTTPFDQLTHWISKSVFDLGRALAKSRMKLSLAGGFGVPVLSKSLEPDNLPFEINSSKISAYLNASHLT